MAKPGEHDFLDPVDLKFSVGAAVTLLPSQRAVLRSVQYAAKGIGR